MSKRIKCESELECGLRAPWCNWPWREYARDLEDLARLGQRCDAWRRFLSSDTVTALGKLRGHIVWFSKHQAFDRLIMEVSCSQKRLQETLLSLIRARFLDTTNLTPLRKDIYDARGWISLTLDHFVSIDRMYPRTGDPSWEHDVLARNEMPIVDIGLQTRWRVSRDCFRCIRRVKRRKPMAVMVFTHPQLDGRFEGQRWCAEQEWIPGASRQDMETALLPTVAERCKRYLVTIVE